MLVSTPIKANHIIGITAKTIKEVVQHATPEKVSKINPILMEL